MDEIQKIKVDYYNNLGIGIVSIGFVLNYKHELSIAKSFLILPFIVHSNLLGYLANKKTNVQSIERLLADRVASFSNFNRRYYDTLPLSINSIQYLNETGYINLSQGNIKLKREMHYSTSMGVRAEKINRAAEKISTLLDDSLENLYLNLRIEI